MELGVERKSSMADQEQSTARKTGQTQVARKGEEDPVGKVYDSRLMRRLGRYVRPYWIQAIISSVAVSLKSLSDVAGPFLVMLGIDRYFPGGADSGAASADKLHGFASGAWLTRHLSNDPVHGITQLAGIYLCLQVCSYLFEFIQTYLMQWTGQKIMFDLRRDIFRHMQRMHIGFFDAHPVGRLVTRLTSDVDAINDMFTGGVLAIVDDFFTLTIMAIVMLAIKWWLALLAFCRAAADPDCHAHLPRLGARELPACARRHCAHQQLHAGAHHGHERGAALQSRRSRLPRFRDREPPAHGGLQRHDLCLCALLPHG